MSALLALGTIYLQLWSWNFAQELPKFPLLFRKIFLLKRIIRNWLLTWFTWNIFVLIHKNVKSEKTFFLPPIKQIDSASWLIHYLLYARLQISLRFSNGPKNVKYINIINLLLPRFWHFETIGHIYQPSNVWGNLTEGSALAVFMFGTNKPLTIQYLPRAEMWLSYIVSAALVTGN